jgi:hypothetical protein
MKLTRASWSFEEDGKLWNDAISLIEKGEKLKDVAVKLAANSYRTSSSIRMRMHHLGISRSFKTKTPKALQITKQTTHVQFIKLNGKKFELVLKPC